MPRFRLLPTIFACCCFWAMLGLLLGATVRIPGVGFTLGLLFGIIYVVLGTFGSVKFALEMWNARLLDQSAAPNLYEMLRELCDLTDVPLPSLYASPEHEPNAFVVAGRDGESAIVVTHGLTRRLSEDEVQAVMALMIARLATGAMADWTTAAALAGLPLYWGRRVSPLLNKPCAALLRLTCQPGILQAADSHAAHLSATPAVLFSALTSIEAAYPEESVHAGNPATALLFAAPPYAHFVSTWPTVQERIDKVDVGRL